MSDTSTPTQFIINGGRALSGTITVLGSKNSALKVVAATLLTDQPCVIENVPRIEDINRMIELIEGLGARVAWRSDAERAVEIVAKDIDPNRLDPVLVSRFRASSLVIGPLLARFGHVRIPQPGGCHIGARPMDTHFNAMEALGATITSEQGTREGDKIRDYFILKADRLEPAHVVLDEFSVTATENTVLLATAIDGTTTIDIAAAEPHTQQVCEIAVQMGATIEGIGTHSLTITGTTKPRGFNVRIIPDYIEAGTLVIAALATKSRITINEFPTAHLRLFLRKLDSINAKYEITPSKDPATVGIRDSIEVRPSTKLKAFRIDTHPHPGFPTDLQAPMSILATQCEGTSLIHDTMYDGRMRHLDELRKMGANTMIADPHRGVITGPTPLFGQEITSLDLRSGATVIIAALVAQGTSIIENGYQVDRGYERLDERLGALGADIKRV